MLTTEISKSKNFQPPRHQDIETSRQMLKLETQNAEILKTEIAKSKNFQPPRHEDTKTSRQMLKHCHAES